MKLLEKEKITTYEDLKRSQLFLDSDPFRNVRLPPPAPRRSKEELATVAEALQKRAGERITLYTPQRTLEGMFDSPPSLTTNGWFWHYQGKKVVGSLYCLSDLHLEGQDFRTVVRHRGETQPSLWQRIQRSYHHQLRQAGIYPLP